MVTDVQRASGAKSLGGEELVGEEMRLGDERMGVCHRVGVAAGDCVVADRLGVLRYAHGQA